MKMVSAICRLWNPVIFKKGILESSSLFSKTEICMLLHRNPWNIAFNCYRLIIHHRSIAYTSHICNSLKLCSDSQNAVESSFNSDDQVKNPEFAKMFDLLKLHKVSQQEIEKHLSVLRNNPSCTKAMLLVEIMEQPDCLLPLIALPVATLNKAAKQACEDQKLENGFPNRIAYLCHHLKLDVDDLIKLVVKHTSLMTMKFTRLDTKMRILKSGNIDIEYIVKDPWIFNYNEKLLKERVTAAQEVGLSLKPWFIRCPKKFFLKQLSMWEKTQYILQGVNQTTYLAERLDCSEDYIRYLMTKNTLLPTINVVKLEKILDFLYERGYTPAEVRLFPKIFCCNVETLRRRFEKLYNIKKTVPALPQLGLRQGLLRSQRTNRNAYVEQ